MERNIEKTYTTSQLGKVSIISALQRPFLVTISLILKVFALILFLNPNTSDYYRILSVFAFFYLEIVLLILFLRTKLRFQRLYGKNVNAKYTLSEDKMIYTLEDRTLAINWDVVTSVKITKRFIVIKKDNVILLRIYKMKKFSEDYILIEKYIKGINENFKFNLIIKQ